MVVAAASHTMEPGYITPKKTKKVKSKQSSTVSTPSSTSTTSTKRSTPSNSPSESAAKRLKNCSLVDSSDDEVPPTKKSNKKKKMKKKKEEEEEDEEEEEEEEEKKEKKEKKKKKNKKKKKVSTSPDDSTSNNKLGKKKKIKSTKGSSDKSSGNGLPLLVLTDVRTLTDQDLKDIIVSDPDSNITEEDLNGMDREALILEWLNRYKLFEVKALITFLHTQLQTDEAQMRKDLDAINKWPLKKCAIEAAGLLKRLENARETPSLTA